MANDHDVNEDEARIDTRGIMTSLARGIDLMLNGLSSKEDGPPDVGFVLLVFPFEGHEGNCNFISNADQNDVITILKKQAETFEQKLKDGAITEHVG